MHRPWSLFHRKPEGVSDCRRDAGGVDDLAGHLGEGLHRGDDIDDLKASLLGAPYRLLAGDEDHRHGAEVGIGRASREIERARSEGGETDAGSSGKPSMRRRHEGGRLLVPRQHQFNAGGPKRLQKV
ncbi:hypothetical protein D3C73_1171820 [compost metagenome]